MTEQAKQVNSILGKLTSLGTNAISSTAAQVVTPETGSYLTKVLFYILFYTFIIFLILTLVHFTITPVFRFTPASKGYIGVPGTTDNQVYWANQVPDSLASAPNPDDTLHSYKFENNFSFSIDLFVTQLSDTDANSRLVLFKTFDFDGSGRSRKAGMSAEQLQQLCGTQEASSAASIQDRPSDSDLQKFWAGTSSMIMYLTETNDLVVTFFVGPNGTVYNSRPIRNIPLNTPFRITVVVEERLFTVYLNGKQTFQRIVSEGIRLNSTGGLKTDTQRFYAPPLWAEQPKKTIFIQNLVLWPRVISYSEVASASPALATADSFKVPADMKGASCS